MFKHLDVLIYKHFGKLYFTGYISYVSYNMYIDSSNFLKKYRYDVAHNKNINWHIMYDVDTEYTAAKYGACQYLPLYLFVGTVWPVTLLMHIIPIVVSS